MSKHGSAALSAALALIERKGWAQPGRAHECYPGEPTSPECSYGGYCAHVAIMNVNGDRAEAVKALSLTVDPAGRGTSLELVAWNDARGRTVTQIRDAFARAIERTGGARHDRR